MRRQSTTESMGFGGYSLAAGITTVALLVVWLLLGEGRSGSLTYCFAEAPWLRQLIGVLLIVSFTAAIVLLALAFSDGTWRLGLFSILVIVTASPVALVVWVFMAFGDPGPEGFDYCLFTPR